MEKQIPPERQRNWGIDALRMVATIMVLVLHILNLGKVLQFCPQGSMRYIGGTVAMAATYCTVNCYGLISGYVGLNSRYRYSKLALLWVQVVFYNLLGLVVGLFMWPEKVTLRRLLTSFLPVMSDYYWYFTAYFATFLLVPIFNKGLQSLTRRQARVLSVIIVFIFTVFPTVLAKDTFSLQRGYTMLWLSLLYILGGCMRRGEIFTGRPKWLLLLGYGLCVAVAAIPRLIWDTDSFHVLGLDYSGRILTEYVSPPILLCAMILLAVFAGIKIKNPKVQKAIRVLAPASFGIYIFHMQFDVLNLIFRLPLFRWISWQPAPLMLLLVLLTAVVLYLIFAVVEKLRQQLFAALKIQKGLDKLEDKLLGNLWNET